MSYLLTNLVKTFGHPMIPGAVMDRTIASEDERQISAYRNFTPANKETYRIAGKFVSGGIGSMLELVSWLIIAKGAFAFMDDIPEAGIFLVGAGSCYRTCMFHYYEFNRRRQKGEREIREYREKLSEK